MYPIAFSRRYSKPLLAFHYEVIQLNRLDWRAFVQHENPLANALMARMAIAPEDRPLVKLQCLRLLATRKLDPARMALLMVFVEAYLPLTPVEQERFEAELGRLPAGERSDVVEKFSLYDLGHERGEEKGRQEGSLHLLTRLLERRLGALGAERQARLAGLSLARIEALADVCLDFGGFVDLDAWLARQEPRSR